jgi:hypothetical protein
MGGLVSDALYWHSLQLVRLALAIAGPARPPIVHIAGRGND